MKQSRWFLFTFALLILLSLIQAKWRSLQHFKQQEHRLQIAVQQASQQQERHSSLTIRPQRNLISPQAVFEAVMFAMQNGLRINQWRVLNAQTQSGEMKIIELELMGVFQQQLVFLSQLLQGAGVTFIQALEWQLQDDHLLRLKIKYAWLPVLKPKKYVDQAWLDVVRMMQPFQSGVSSPSVMLSHKHHDDVSISTLRFAGRWQNAGQQFALITWPDQCGRMVMLGQRLGLERAVVVAIHRDHLALSLTKSNQEVLIWS